KAGGAYVPLDPAYPAKRLAFMLEDAAVPVLLTQASLLAALPVAETQLLCLDRDWPTMALNPTSNLHTPVEPHHLAYVIYTSGSTGRPKGVLVTHHNVMRLFAATDHWYGFHEADVWTLFHSYAFDFSVWELWGALLYGGRLVVVPYLVSRSPEAFYQLLCAEGVTVVNQTPSAFRQLIHAEEKMNRVTRKQEEGMTSTHAVTSLALRYVIFGGEALELASLHPWFVRHGDVTPQLVNMYGITETTVHVTYRPIRLTDLTPGSAGVPASVIGGPIPDLQLYILDQQQQLVPIGRLGELYVGGAGVSRGYLKRPELTAQRFLPNPFGPGTLYRTGDLAKRLPDGDIEYLGRIDNQVKIRGFRIELGEIEAVLGSHPAVQACVVVAREDVPGEKRLAAYVVAPELLLADSRERVAALRSHLQRRLPDYMVPGTFVWLDALPLTPNGKVDRRRLPAPSQQEIQSVARPRSQEEQQLTVLWEKLLGSYPIGIFDNFFELGGHSLLAIRLMGEMRQHFGQELPLQVLFTHPTVAELAELLQKGGELWSFNPIVAIQPRGHRPALYCCPGAGGHTLYLHALARALGDDQPFYGLEAAGLDGKSLPHTTVEAAAAAHVWELRRHQPVGPYYLAGHSFGAQIAFEMARQLHAMGETLGALIVLDGGAPGREPIEMDEVEAILLYESLMVQEVGGRPELTAEELRPLSSEERLQLFKQSAVKAGLMPAGASTDFLRALIAEAIANHRVEYSPARLEAAPIHLIAATEGAGADESELAANWSEYGTVICYETPGEHLTMLHPPNVQRLAETIRTILQNASTVVSLIF
ncbi:MAG: amino acid adenylation domain-containing protein, partial [Caldilinea sp.]